MPMKVFNSGVRPKAGIPEPTVAEQLFLNLLEADLKDDDTLPTCDMTDDDCSLNDEFGSDYGNDYIDDPKLYATNTSINESKYETANIDKVVRACTHLDQTQQNNLREVLDCYPKLFDNELGTYPDEQIHLDLRDDAVPHCQP